MKKVRTIRIDKELSDRLDSICVRHGDVSWHIEQALGAYLAKPDHKKAIETKPVLRQFVESEFDQVWALYEKKGNRKTSLARWAKLKDSDKQDIYNHLPAYLLSTPNKKFRKDFQSYLNLECWNDEVIPNDEENRPNGHRAADKQTPAQRTRAAAERWEAEQEGNVQALGSDAGGIRPPVEQPVRSGANRDMGTLIDGDYTRTD